MNYEAFLFCGSLHAVVLWFIPLWMHKEIESYSPFVRAFVRNVSWIVLSLLNGFITYFWLEKKESILEIFAKTFVIIGLQMIIFAFMNTPPEKK